MQWPNQNELEFFCGTKHQIELKQGSKFEFVHGLNVYKKNYQFGPSKDPDIPFLCNGPLEGASFLSPNKTESVQHGKTLF